ncbi:MAG: NAD(P)-dependent oxidoreductase, partial [Chloroflexi bacterium]|nr:NAD(P)-dependent oxidoreductase [Chloroflexota bacterium]
AMKPTAHLVNTSRGPTVDEVALVDALERGEIAGAGLDVFEQEPLRADSPLTTMDNVVLTPHSASYSDFAFQLLSRRVGESVVDVLSGHWPRFVANKGILNALELEPTRHPD